MKPPKPVKHRLEYALVRGIELFLRCLPTSLALSFGEGLGGVMSVLMAKRQRLILENIAHAFPEKSADQRARIADATWRNLGRTAVEFARLWKFTEKDMKRDFVWEGVEHVEQALAQGKGVVMVACHFSNWEKLGMAIQGRFGHFMAIARPMRNPYVDAWVQSKRSSGGMSILLHREAVRASMKWLRQKNIIGILVDQNLYHGGVFVNFFGRPAASTTLPALLHMRMGAPVIVTYSLREGKKVRAIFEPPVQFPDVPDEANRALIYTQTISDRFEAIIRRYPDNWFWIHNRWKRKPE